MSPHPSPLADSVASLRVATLATQAHAWLPAAIHALILACLARILGRLEEMIRLWQAGLLPLPMARPGTVRANPANPWPREARQDSISVPCLPPARHRPPARARTADHAAAEAGSPMETDRKMQGSSCLLRFASPSPCGNPIFPTRAPQAARLRPLSRSLPSPACPEGQFPKNHFRRHADARPFYCIIAIKWSRSRGSARRTKARAGPGGSGQSPALPSLPATCSPQAPKAHLRRHCR
jgi:hypothetical protein